jgi:hypothetical protein
MLTNITRPLLVDKDAYVPAVVPTPEPQCVWL